MLPLELQECKVNRNISLKTTKYIAFVLLICCTGEVLAQGQQDPWLKRNWNNMIARFNIYFNAQQKFESSVENLTKKQVDDFNEIIDIYPYGTEADAKSMKAPMEETMKKASKVIQNKPKSKWADNAYFLIGQTHFFSGDYFSAIETFQFVNASYTDPNIKAMSQLWLMKAYIQQEKYDDAEAIFGLLKKNTSTHREFLTNLNLSAGDLMVKQNKKGEAIKLLTKGLHKLKDKTLKYRTHFVLGQLYLDQKKYSKANANFIKVLRLNAPYIYVFQANLGMAKSTSEAGGQGAQKTKKYLKRMLDDDKNIDYYDQIYYELAKLEFNDGNESAGLNYMKKSAENSGSNSVQQTKTYLYLADYYFELRDYTKAQFYYDSTISVIPDDYENVDKIKAKHSILSKLIENIETIKTQDSLLALSNLDRDVLDDRINSAIEEEEERKRLAKEEEEIRREQERLNNRTGRSRNTITNNSGSTWYFYNTTTVSRGTNDFNRLWGKRKYADFWRFVNKNVMDDALSDEDKPEEEEENSDPDTYISSQDKEQNKILEDIDATKRKFYKDIPFSATAKLVANRKIQIAYLGIGKIYFDDLKEYIKSRINFNILLERYPETKYKPEVLFYLSKGALETGDTNSSNKYARQIADEYPESVYNSVLNSKEIQEDDADKEVIALYSTMYSAFHRDDFDQVDSIKQKIDQEFAGNSIQGKIDYLYALAIGKSKGREAYLKELEIVKEAYRGTEIGEIAAYTLRLLSEVNKPSLESVYGPNNNGTFYYVITGKTDKESEVQIQLDNYNQQFFASSNLVVSNLVLGDRQMFYIKQFKNKTQAMEYHTDMISSNDFLKNAGMTRIESYAISNANFTKLVKSKSEKEYLVFFKSKVN